MTINLSVPRSDNELKPRITVIGVGGAGGNAVNNMIHLNLEGVDFVCANTDAQSLAQSAAERKVQLGIGITRGLGAGARPDIGREAAEEAMGELMDHIQGSHMVFITAGMGGGTGTGAAPVIARAAREHGILTVGVVTKPFHFEGSHRMRIAEQGIEELTQFVDTLIIIPNQNLFRIATERTTFAEAFKLADDVLYSGVRGVTDLMVMPGLINLDFADIRTVMTEMGKAMMGTGEAEGEKRAIAAAEAAIANPLLDDVSMKGARGVLINITGGPDMTLYEVDEAANRIREEVDADANIIFGATLDPNLNGRVRISMVATGIEAQAQVQPRPLSLVGGTRAGAIGQASRGDGRPALAAAAARPLPAAIGNTALSMSAQPSPHALAQAVAQAVVQPAAAPVAQAAPVPVAAAPAPTPVPAADAELDEQVSQLIAAATAATPAASPPAAQAAPLARPRVQQPAPAAPLAQAAQPASAQTEAPLAAAPLTAAPAAQPKPTNPLTKGFVPTPQAIAAAAAERKAAQQAAEQAPPAMDAPFIAPAPAEPTLETAAPAPSAAARAPQRPAMPLPPMPARPAAEPEPAREQRSSGLDLFKRVTGLATLRRQPAAPKAAPVAPTLAPTPAKTDAMVKDTPRPTPQIGGLNPADRPQQARQEDDLLDIPAFLRRQAN
jgi:cell division protein FtsZ